MTDPERRLAELLRDATPEPPPTIDLGRLARQARSAPRRGGVFGRWSAPALAAAAVGLVVATVAVTMTRGDGDGGPVAGPPGSEAVSAGSTDGSPAGPARPLETALAEPKVSNAPQTFGSQTSPPEPASTGRPMGEKARPVVIESVTVTADQRTLTGHFLGAPGPKAAPCGADYTARLSETADKVMLVVITDRNPRSKVCTAMAAARTVTATLQAPLNGRPVLSADKKAVPVTTR